MERASGILSCLSHFQIVLGAEFAQPLPLENVVLVDALELVCRVVPYSGHLEGEKILELLSFL